MTTIAVARSGPENEPARTAEVPQKWHDHNEAIWDVHEVLGPILMENEFIFDVFLGRSERTIDGLGYLQYTVEFYDTATRAERSSVPDDLTETEVPIPDDIQVTSIRKTETTGEISAQNCAGQVSPDPYHGGVILDGHGWGTSGYRMEDGSGNEYMVTANHVVAPNCSVDNGFVPVADNGDQIGGVHDGHKNHDWALVGVDSSSGIQDLSKQIWYNGGFTTTIKAWKPKAGLNYIIGQNGQVWKQGRMTGWDTGVLRGIGSCATDNKVPPCVRMDCAGVKVEVPNTGGDSGGPLWDQDDGGAEVISQISLGNELTGNTVCNGRDVKKYAYGWPTYKIVANNPYTV
jgi:hypothetical protein